MDARTERKFLGFSSGMMIFDDSPLLACRPEEMDLAKRIIYELDNQKLIRFPNTKTLDEHQAAIFQAQRCVALTLAKHSKKAAKR